MIASQLLNLLNYGFKKKPVLILEWINGYSTIRKWLQPSNIFKPILGQVESHHNWPPPLIISVPLTRSTSKWAMDGYSGCQNIFGSGAIGLLKNM